MKWFVLISLISCFSARAEFCHQINGMRNLSAFEIEKIKAAGGGKVLPLLLKKQQLEGGLSELFLDRMLDPLSLASMGVEGFARWLGPVVDRRDDAIRSRMQWRLNHLEPSAMNPRRPLAKRIAYYEKHQSELTSVRWRALEYLLGYERSGEVRDLTPWFENSDFLGLMEHYFLSYRRHVFFTFHFGERRDWSREAAWKDIVADFATRPVLEDFKAFERQLLVLEKHPEFWQTFSSDRDAAVDLPPTLLYGRSFGSYLLERWIEGGQHFEHTKLLMKLMLKNGQLANRWAVQRVVNQLGRRIVEQQDVRYLELVWMMQRPAKSLQLRFHPIPPQTLLDYAQSYLASAAHTSQDKARLNRIIELLKNDIY